MENQQKKNQLKRGLRLIIRFFKKPKYTLEDLLYRIQEKVYGIETIEEVNVKDLGIPMDLIPHGYESSGDSYLVKVLKVLKINNKDSIVDLGCGKGRAVLCFAKFPFKKIIGIEFSHTLFLKSISNINKVNDNRIQIIHGDAGEYDDYKDINYIYMFNPFGQIIVNRVLENISQSYQNFPRVITLIYNNPFFHNEIDCHGIFRKVAEYTTHIEGMKIFIYKTNE